MKINELRIGNYVQSTKDTCLFYKGEFIVGASEFNKFYMHGMKYIEPIPLTEDWLVKFGFDKVKSYEGIYYNKYIEKIDLDLDFYISEKVFIVQSDFGSFNLFDSVQNVHQLQNLYFALTGEELIIKNK